MKHRPIIALLCLLLALACAACAQAVPVTAPSPEPTAAPSPAPTPAPTPEPTATPVPLPEALTLSVRERVPADEQLRSLYAAGASPAGGFFYPAYCTAWEEDGAIRVEPQDFFARVSLRAFDKSAPDAPKRPEDLLDTEKWGATADSTTVGGSRPALCMRHLKYDTYRYWVVWETESSDYLLYGACFDSGIDVLHEIMDTIKDSFCAQEELVSADLAPGTLLLAQEGQRVLYAGAALVGADGALSLRLSLHAENEAEQELSLRIAAGTQPDPERLTLAPGESADWVLTLPLTESGAELTLGEQTLPIRIEKEQG